MNGLIEGKKYVLSTPVDTVITDVKYNIPLGTVKAGQQYVFQAVSDAVTVADGCTIRPFEGSNGASVGVVGGSGEGGSGGSSDSPVWIGYIEFDDETGEAIAADYSGLGISASGGLLFFNNYKYRGEWNCDMKHLKSAEYMFKECNNLTSFNGDMNSLTNGNSMFASCYKLTSFKGDLSSLTDGTNMFASCITFTSFEGDLSSLTDGTNMFTTCKLDKESVIGIITCLKEKNTCSSSAQLTIGVNKQYRNDPELLEVLGITSWTSTLTTTTLVGHGGGTWTITLQAI